MSKKLRLYSDNPDNSHLAKNTHVIDDSTPFDELTINGAKNEKRIVSLFVTLGIVTRLYRVLTDKKLGGSPDNATGKLTFIKPTILRIVSETGKTQSELIAHINAIKPRQSDVSHAKQYFAKNYDVSQRG